MTLTLSPAKVGTWALHEILTSAQVNKIASELVKAVDGVGGGTYTLSVGDLQFTGSATFILALAMQLTAGHAFAVDGHINLSATGQVNLASGATLNLAGGATINVASAAAIALAAGASLTLAATATIAATLGAQITGSLNLAGEIVVVSGGLVTVQAGGILNVQSGGTIDFARAEDLKIFNESVSWRSHLVAQSVSRLAGIPAWDSPFSRGWVQNDVSLRHFLRIPLMRLPGEVLTSIFFGVNGAGGSAGGHGGDVQFLPVVSLIKVSTTGTVTTVATTTDSSANRAAYDVAHLITLDSGTDVHMPYTVTSDPHYLEIDGEGGTNSQANSLELRFISGLSVASRFRNNFEFA